MYIGGDGGTISIKNVGMGDEVENRNIPECETSEINIKADDSTDMEGLGPRPNKNQTKEI